MATAAANRISTTDRAAMVGSCHFCAYRNISIGSVFAPGRTGTTLFHLIERSDEREDRGHDHAGAISAG
jgi:hypothetical protein